MRENRTFFLQFFPQLLRTVKLKTLDITAFSKSFSADIAGNPAEKSTKFPAIGVRS
jgi:hypothetical protein